MKTDDEKTRLSMVGRQSTGIKKAAKQRQSRDNDQQSRFVRSPSNCLKKLLEPPTEATRSIKIECNKLFRN